MNNRGGLATDDESFMLSLLICDDSVVESEAIVGCCLSHNEVGNVP